MARTGSNRRRGLSSVVGAVFMVLVMLGALNVVLMTLRQQDSVTQTLIEKSNSDLDRMNEEIAISDIRLTDDNKLNMTVTNSGGAAAQLASIYVVNETSAPKEQYRYDLDNVIDGRESVSEIGSDLDLTVDTGNKYSVKVVTEAGNSAVTTVTPLDELPLKMAAFVIPPSTTSGQDMSVLFAVINNQTDTNLVTRVSPTIDVDLSCVESPTCVYTPVLEADEDVLIPSGSMYLFKWTYNVKGPSGTIVTFDLSLEDAAPGNSVTVTGKIIPVSSAQVAESFLFARLIAQPEIEAIFPSPFGIDSGSNKGIFGAVIANPTEGDMKVRKFVISVFSARGNSNDQIICKTSTDFTDIGKPGTGTWTCPTANQAIWTGSVTIPARSAKEFWVALKGGSTGANADVQAAIINFNVFTDYGQFTKTGYDFGLRGSSAAHPVANVYMSTVSNSKSTSDMTGIKSVVQGQSVTIKATIGNFAAADVDAGTKLIIDIPKDFTVEMSQPSGFDACSPVEFSDGSTQIACSLTSALNNAAKTVEFTITAPAVDYTKLYVLYLLADGSSESNAFTVGPIGEMVLRVTDS